MPRSNDKNPNRKFTYSFRRGKGTEKVNRRIEDAVEEEKPPQEVAEWK